MRPVLLPFLLGGILAYLLAPLVEALAARGLGRSAAILLLYALLALALATALVLVIPAGLAELQRLALAAPEYATAARSFLAEMHGRYRRLPMPESLRQALDSFIAGMEGRAATWLEAGLDGMFDAVGVLAALVIAPIVAFYLLRDLDLLKTRLHGALPHRLRPTLLRLLADIDRVLAGFVRGQLLVALLVGLLVALAMHLLGLRYATLLGLIAAAAELVPYVGPILGAVPAVWVGLLHSPWTALQAALIFLVIQQVESTILSPRIIGHAVGLHPLAVIFSVLAGGYLAGFWGLVLAVPVAGILRVVWRFAWRACTG